MARDFNLSADPRRAIFQAFVAGSLGALLQGALEPPSKYVHQDEQTVQRFFICWLALAEWAPDSEWAPQGKTNECYATLEEVVETVASVNSIFPLVDRPLSKTEIRRMFTKAREIMYEEPDVSIVPLKLGELVSGRKLFVECLYHGGFLLRWLDQKIPFALVERSYEPDKAEDEGSEEGAEAEGIEDVDVEEW